MGKFNLSGQAIVNRLKSWNRVSENVATGSNDPELWRERGSIAMWTKTVDDETMVRVAVPVGGMTDRFAIELKAPEDLVSADVVLFRVREVVPMTSSAEHHAIHHNRTTNENVYAVVGVSGAKKKGKYFFYSPVTVKDAENRNQLRLDISSKPVACDSRQKLVNHPMTQDWGKYVKGFFAHFQTNYSLVDNVVKFPPMRHDENDGSPF